MKWAFLASIIFAFGLFIWAGFDLHNRLPYSTLALIPMLILRTIVRWKR